MTLNFTFFFVVISLVNTEIPSGSTIVANSIEFHDPNSNWQNLQAHLKFVESRPKKQDRFTSIDIDNIRGNFCSTKEVKKMHVQRHIRKDSCFYNIDEYEELTDREIIEYKLNDNRSFTLRNYYLYLWGLPMKLNDKGTQIEERATLKTFGNKNAYEVKVTYNQSTGSDVWYFYFNPKNFEMVGYRFYHDESKNDGEYILLEDNEFVFGIQMPKSRSWYTHQDSTFLGTDVLVSFDDLKHAHF